MSVYEPILTLTILFRMPWKLLVLTFSTHKRRVILQYEGTIDAGGYISQTKNDTFIGYNPTRIWHGLNSISN